MAEPNKGNTPPRDRTPRRARKKKVAVEARRTKVFTYRGHTMEELLVLPQDELVAALPARARRFLSRIGVHEEAQKLLVKVSNASEGDKLRTHLRDFPILPVMVGKVMEVHNGKDFHAVTVVPEMIGHKLGEFALTRKSVKHTGPGVGATRSSKFMPLK